MDSSVENVASASSKSIEQLFANQQTLNATVAQSISQLSANQQTFQSFNSTVSQSIMLFAIEQETVIATVRGLSNVSAHSLEQLSRIQKIFNATFIDKCLSEEYNCHFNAFCINHVYSFSCQCKFGYSGDGVTSCVWSSMFVAVSSGNSHSCGLLNTGQVKCWGPPNHSREFTVDIPYLTPRAVNISSAGSRSCAILSSGALKCWGVGDSGSLGCGNRSRWDCISSTPIGVFGLSSAVVAVSLGSSHSCVLMSIGSVKCWGFGGNGRLGYGGTENQMVPVDVVSLSSPVISISAGGGHTCALLSTGAAMCWGDGSMGQLGTGNRNDQLTPQYVSDLSSGVASISAGGCLTCVVLSSGGAMCWGGGQTCQVFIGSFIQSPSCYTPKGVSSGVVTISTSGEHTCALLSSGAAKCWGRGDFGQLGHGNAALNGDHAITPLDVVGLPSSIVSLSTGGGFTCAVLLSGSIMCWGNGRNGELGYAGGSPNIVQTKVPIFAVPTFP
jgi:alpha-tubulin suppressor-like RCC1 family protein